MRNGTRYRHSVVITAMAALFTVAGIAGGARADTIYDPTADFSLASNPNGVWSYGWDRDNLGASYAFELFDQPDITYENGTEISRGWEPIGAAAPVIWINTGYDRYGVPHGALALHPGPGQDAPAAILRFTAPDTGTYDVVGEFFAGDSAIESLGVRRATSWLWQGTDAGTFDLDALDLAAGQTLDFWVYGTYSSGNTPLDLTITQLGAAPVPEPATLTLFGLGLAGLAVARTRKRRA